jgi:hypothetical protein
MLMVALAPYILHVKAPKHGLVFKAQVALAVLTGGQLRQWMRTRDMDNPEGLVLDLVACAADPLVRGVPRVLASMLMSGR